MKSLRGHPTIQLGFQIAARFDVDEVVASFSDSDEGEFAIPSQWFDQGADIFDIVVQRQVLGDTGWSAPEVVTVLPGHLSFRADIESQEIDAMQRETIIRTLRSGSQDEIANPDFYLLKGAVPSSMDSPSEWDGEIQIDEDNPASELEQRLQRNERKIDQQLRKIESLEERIEREQSGGRGGGGGGSPIGGGGGSGGRGSDRLNRLQAQLTRAFDDLQTLQQEKDGS